MNSVSSRRDATAILCSPKELQNNSREHSATTVDLEFPQRPPEMTRTWAGPKLSRSQSHSTDAGRITCLACSGWLGEMPVNHHDDCTDSELPVSRTRRRGGITSAQDRLARNSNSESAVIVKNVGVGSRRRPEHCSTSGSCSPLHVRGGIEKVEPIIFFAANLAKSVLSRLQRSRCTNR